MRCFGRALHTASFQVVGSDLTGICCFFCFVFCSLVGYISGMCVPSLTSPETTQMNSTYINEKYYMLQCKWMSELVNQSINQSVSEYSLSIGFSHSCDICPKGVPLEIWQQTEVARIMGRYPPPGEGGEICSLNKYVHRFCCSGRIPRLSLNQHSLYVGVVEKSPPSPLTGEQYGKMEPK